MRSSAFLAETSPPLLASHSRPPSLTTTLSSSTASLACGCLDASTNPFSSLFPSSRHAILSFIPVAHPPHFGGQSATSVIFFGDANPVSTFFSSPLLSGFLFQSLPILVPPGTFVDELSEFDTVHLNFALNSCLRTLHSTSLALRPPPDYRESRVAFLILLDFGLL
ncbi:hypothetical protein BJ165DRAFT_1535524 [Panaeolus papilionaceus]|nr:hypothetical protein BJ165DRAFT_1535524 [Panaeolus papilionaceus]